MSLAQDFYSFSGEEGDFVQFEDSIYDIWNNCALESLKSISPTILKLVISNVLFGILVTPGCLSESYFHILSGMTGMYLLNTLENLHGKIICIVCFVLSYFLLQVTNALRRNAYVHSLNLTKIILVVSLVSSEYLLIDPEIWMQIRGLIMILSMKVISLCHEFKKSDKHLSILEYFGYICCGANVLFGPWMSYSDYRNLYIRPTKKTIWWCIHILYSVFLSLFFLLISNCLTSFINTDNYNRWFVAYIEALSFRTSHYFICYLSEASMLSAGYKDSKIWMDSNKWRFTVANPLEIEFPSALANVVTHWNRPMHDFLKQYVYRYWLPHGKFAAVFATFVISSFLHGFELKVSVVLITIGIFSYLQMVPREIVSDCISCCVRVRPCKSCNHIYKRHSWRARIINLVYSFFTVLHLAYLGILMDSSTDEVGIYEKWKNLYFVSHLIMVVNLLIVI